MIRRKLLILSLLASAVSAFSEEERLPVPEPVWELRLDLHGDAGSGLASWLRAKLPPTHELALDGGPSSVRLTGVSSPSVAETGWLLELRGVKDIGGVSDRLREKSSSEEEGCFVIDAGSGAFAAWIEEPDVLHCAFPAALGGAALPPAPTFANGEFLSGWVDLEKAAAGRTTSKLLGLTRHIAFSASVQKGLLNIQLDLRFKDTLGAVAFQERFSLFQQTFESLLQDSQEHPFVLKATPLEDGLRVSVGLNSSQVEELKIFIDTTLQSPSGNAIPAAE